MNLSHHAPRAAALLGAVVYCSVASGQGLTLPTFGSGVYTTAGNDSPGHFQGSLTLDLENESCDYEGQFWFMEGDVDHAHIHSAPLGQDGPILFHLGHPVAGNFDGSFGGVTGSKLTALTQDHWYINIHSSLYPGGEARSQIHMPRFLEVPALTGGQVSPPSGSSARGGATLSYDAPLRTFTYALEVHGLEGSPASARVYLDDTGQTVIFELEQTSAATWEGAAALVDPEHVVRIMRGEAFVQIATDLHPGGEVRGPLQVGPLNADSTYFGAVNGGVQRLQIDGGASLAGNSYLILGTMSGTQGGFDLRGDLHVPLTPDLWMRRTVALPNQAPYENSFGVLDQDGRATTTLALPVGTSLAGLTLHHASLIFDKAGSRVTRVSVPVPFSVF